METRIESKNLEKMQKTESKNEVSETRIEMDYQEHEEYKSIWPRTVAKVQRSGETERVFKISAKAKSWMNAFRCTIYEFK